MSVRGRIALALSACTATLAGCSLLLDGDEFTGASPVPQVEGGPDAILEAAPPSPDGSADAGCDATFCDDFDELPLGGRWDQTVLLQNGALGIETTTVRSAPNAMRASVRPTPGEALLVKNLPKGAAIRCDFDIFFETVTDAGFADLFRLETAGGPLERYLFFLAVDRDGIGLREDATPIGQPCDCPRKGVDLVKPTSNAWHHLVLDLDFTTATVAFDGVQIHSSAFGGFVPDAGIEMRLGIRSYPSVSALDVRFDNLVCNVK